MLPCLRSACPPWRQVATLVIPGAGTLPSAAAMGCWTTICGALVPTLATVALCDSAREVTNLLLKVAHENADATASMRGKLTSGCKPAPRHCSVLLCRWRQSRERQHNWAFWTGSYRC
jgi:hypothetical protein